MFWAFCPSHLHCTHACPLSASDKVNYSCKQQWWGGQTLESSHRSNQGLIRPSNFQAKQAINVTRFLFCYQEVALYYWIMYYVRQNQIKHVNVQSHLTIYVWVILSSCLMAKRINPPFPKFSDLFRRQCVSKNQFLYPVVVWALISSLLKKIH